MIATAVRGEETRFKRESQELFTDLAIHSDLAFDSRVNHEAPGYNRLNRPRNEFTEIRILLVEDHEDTAEVLTIRWAR
jgi:hypothetical protein